MLDQCYLKKAMDIKMYFVYSLPYDLYKTFKYFYENIIYSFSIASCFIIIKRIRAASHIPKAKED